MSSIYGINSMYQQMNQYRLLNAQGTQSQKALSTEKVDPISSISSTYGKNQAIGALPMESALFAKQYSGSMRQLSDAAKTLRNAGSASGSYNVTSSGSAADVSQAFTPIEAANYKIDIAQIATVQKNTSQAMDAKGTGLTGTLELITSGKNASFTVKPDVANNADALTDLAKQINSAGLGVNANVAQKDGKATLELTSANTGEGNAFIASGSLAQATGLSTPVQQAQNAQYSVSKNDGMAVQRTSSTNDVYVDGNLRIKANLKESGTVNVSVKADAGKDTTAIQTLVDSYNSSLKLLNDNADRGVGVLTQMKRMLISTGDIQSMNMIGISSNKDGTLSFDKSTYQKATSEDPTLTSRVLGGSFGLADSIYTAAQRGLTQSSNSLLSQDLKTAKLQQSYNTIGMMSSYSRNGAYALSNYQMSGALLNMLV